jgi:hypothetical protein
VPAAEAQGGIVKIDETSGLKHRAVEIEIQGWNEDVISLILWGPKPPEGKVRPSQEALLDRTETRILIHELQASLDIDDRQRL